MGDARRVLTALAAVLVTACGNDVVPRTAPTASPTPSATVSATPSPAMTTVPPMRPDVRLTVVTKKGGSGEGRWTAEHPTLHGIAEPARSRINGLLTTTVERHSGPAAEEGNVVGPSEVTAWLSAVDDRYVTVAIGVAVMPTGAAHGFFHLTPYVFERASGRRVSLQSWFHPGSLRAAVRVMSEHLRGRVPEVLGENGTLGGDSGMKPEAANFTAVTPLPEGLEVTFGSYQVAPYAAGLPQVTVPWSVLEPYLALEPPSGNRTPPYRDGRRLDGADLAAVERAIAASPAVGLAKGTYDVARAQQTQFFDDPVWAFATVVPRDGADSLVVVLQQVSGRWKVVDVGENVAGCDLVFGEVQKSVALACG
ncbi:MAG TPA: RsiV family protein [Frankiaceae bacterium]|nr:RsiV family protein [Frankiaceae bacterium]